MDSWIWQPGYPLVSAALVEADGGRALRLRQQRFGFDDGADDGQRWAIPVHVRNGTATSVVLLDGDELVVALAFPDEPVVVNAGGNGFFRVAYDDELRERLDRGFLATSSTSERYSLVDDAWAAVVAGRLGATDVLHLLESFDTERDHTVWQAITTTLRGLGRLVDDGPARTAFQARVRTIVGPALEALGEPVDGEPDLVAKTRGLLTATAGGLGADPTVVERCRGWFAAPDGVDPELVAAATSVVAVHGDRAVHDEMVERFRTAATPQEQLRNLYALAEFDDADLMVATCELAMSPDVRTQNAPFLLRAAIANRRHGAVAWRFVRDHWAEANERFPDNSIIRMVDSVRLLDTPELVADAAAFFAEHPVPQAAKTLDQILERQRVNAALRAREQDPFSTALTV
jgi:puromycin-sensitive aminopeptidase